jgi:hypothetical protein
MLMLLAELVLTLVICLYGTLFTTTLVCFAELALTVLIFLTKLILAEFVLAELVLIRRAPLRPSGASFPLSPCSSA